jgi:hypothetical protein
MTKSAPPIPGQVAIVDLPPGTETNDNPAHTRLDWEIKVEPPILDVFRANPGRVLTMHEAAQMAGVEEPPDPSHDWGRFTQRLHREWMIVPAGYAKSTRRGTASSAVQRWQGGPALGVAKASAR